MSEYNLLNGYVGSKAPYTSKIKALFDPTCTKYLEPFAGGAATFFSIYNGKYEKEGLNDINPNVILLYKALEDDETRQETIEEILKIEKPDDEAIAREQFRKAKKNMLPPTTQIKNIPQKEWGKIARDVYTVYSQSFNCGAKSYSRQKSAEKYKYETRRNLLNAVERLKTHPQISQLNGIGFIKKVKVQRETQMLIDWPYVGLYRNQSKLYLSEMSGLYEHIMGAYALADSQAAVVMCDYRSQYEGVPTVYDAILGDEWHCYKLADTYKHCEVVELGQHKMKAQEFVWTNRVPPNAGLYLSMVDYKEKITIEEYWDRIRYACENRLVPDAHIMEYVSTFSRLYEGKQLLDDDFVKSVKHNKKTK